MKILPLQNQSPNENLPFHGVNTWKRPPLE